MTVGIIEPRIDDSLLSIDFRLRQIFIENLIFSTDLYNLPIAYGNGFSNDIIFIKRVNLCILPSQVPGKHSLPKQLRWQ
jgi:hypothetical protein